MAQSRLLVLLLGIQSIQTVLVLGFTSQAYSASSATSFFTNNNNSNNNNIRTTITTSTSARQTTSTISTSARTSTRLFGKRMKFQPPPRQVDQTEYIQVQSDGEDSWKTMDTVEILDKGGVGVIPTSAGYGFITPLSSKQGLDRLLLLQSQQSSASEEVYLLCSNLAGIDEHCFGIDKVAFKILKKNLPGLYSFVLMAKTTLPKRIVHPKAKTIQIRIPDDPILRYLQDDLLDGMPLLFSPLAGNAEFDDEDEDEDQDINAEYLIDHDATWFNQVDFVVDAGPRPEYDASTVFDLTRRGQPILITEGKGELELAL